MVQVASLAESAIAIAIKPWVAVPEGLAEGDSVKIELSERPDQRRG